MKIKKQRLKKGEAKVLIEMAKKTKNEPSKDFFKMMKKIKKK